MSLANNGRQTEAEAASYCIRSRLLYMAGFCDQL